VGATMTTVTSLLKEVYEGKIEDQKNEEVIAVKRIEQTSENVVDTVGGKYVTFPIRTRRNSGISYRGEETALGAAGQQGYASVQVPLKYGYGRFRVSGQTMELAETNPQAFSSALDEEMDGLKMDIVKDENRIAYGVYQGENASLAKVVAAFTATTTVNVDSTQYLSIGEVIDILHVTTGATYVLNVTITAINSTTQITISSATAMTDANARIYRQGNRGLEPTSFSDITSATSVLHGLDPAVQPVWKGNTVAIGGALSEVNMIKACDTARVNGGKTSVIFTSLGVRRSYFVLLTQQRRYTDTKSYPGGFQGLPFNYGTEIPLVEDPDCPPGEMFYMDESKIKKYRKRPWYFSDVDGSIFKWVSGFDSWEGLMKCYFEYGTKQRNAHVLHTGVTET
jgi:uncharacterized protein YifE (UPF0438 family)